MGQSPWSVKGIDPKARAAAKTAARKEGMTLGEWLNRVILEDGERPAPSVWDPDAEDYSGFDDAHGDNSSGALRAAIERLTERVNRAEQITHDGQSALKALIGERDSTATQSLDEIAEQTADLERRLDIADAQLLRTSRQTVSSEDFRRRFEGLASELASAILATRNQFTRELEGLAKGSTGSDISETLQDVDSRLKDAERKQATKLRMIGTQLELLAGAMQRHVNETTSSLEERVRKLEDLTGTETTEPVSNQISRLRNDHATAIGRIGEEISRLGSALVTRIEDVETRSAEAIQATGEKVADVVEKLDVSNAAPVRNLEERIAQSELRTEQHLAKAMETVEERLQAVKTENSQALTPVQKTMASLAERLKAIETRALEAGLDIQVDIPDPLNLSKRSSRSSSRQPSEPIALSAPQTEDTTAPATDIPVLGLSAEDEALFEPLEFDPEPDRDTASDKPIESFTRSEDEPSSELSSGDETDLSELKATETPEQDDKPNPRKPAVIGATADSDFLATMRARARAQIEEDTTRRSPFNARRSESEQQSGKARRSQPDAKPKASRNKETQSEHTEGRLLLAGTSVLSFTVIGIAASLLIADAVTGSETSVDDIQSADLGSLFAEPATARATPSQTGASSPDIATIEPATNVAPPDLRNEFTQGDPVARYQMALDQLADGNVEEGTALMRRAAEQGLAAAQYRYGLMLQRGDGVEANLAEARDWMVRAAEGGNTRAMQMAGSMYITAEATPENQTIAARWFEEAAWHGMLNSQFNLAILYEQGVGVPLSPGDAYAWFLIAEMGGDTDSGDRARDIAPTLTSQQRNEARSFASTFTPRPVDPAAQGNLEALEQMRTGSLLQVQRAEELLAQLGYSTGPADGSLDPQTREAIMSYQSDRGLTQTGSVDVALLASLEQSATR